MVNARYFHIIQNMKRAASSTSKNKTPYKKTKKVTSVDPPVNATKYTGPVIPKKTSNNEDTCTVELVQQTTLNSTVSSVITQVYGADPSGSPDWSNFTNTWQEFRVLGMRVAYYPANRYNRGSTYTYPLASVIDRQAGYSAAITSWTSAANYGSFQMKSLDDPWYREVKATDIEEMNFQGVSGYSVQYYVKLYADNVSASVNYGLVLLSFRVQFKNRK